MSKIIVFVEGQSVTGYEVVEPNMLEAFRCGLSGADAVTFDRAIKQIGAETMDTLFKHMPRKTSDEALNAFATTRGKAFILVDRLPDLPRDKDVTDLVVEGGKVVLKAAA